MCVQCVPFRRSFRSHMHGFGLEVSVECRHHVCAALQPRAPRGRARGSGRGRSVSLLTAGLRLVGLSLAGSEHSAPVVRLSHHGASRARGTTRKQQASRRVVVGCSLRGEIARRALIPLARVRIRIAARAAPPPPLSPRSDICQISHSVMGRSAANKCTGSRSVASAGALRGGGARTKCLGQLTEQRHGGGGTRSAC